MRNNLEDVNTVLALLIADLPQRVEFFILLAWAIGIFMQGGLTIGNLSALALEPMGHIAGMAASLTAALATEGSVIIAAPIGLPSMAQRFRWSQDFSCSP